MKIRNMGSANLEAGPNMTPLVDIVMVILIFLMLAGRFEGQEHFLVSPTPIAMKGAGNMAPPPGYVPNPPLEIRVDSPTSDKFVATVDRIRTGDWVSLASQMKKLRLGMEAAGKKTDDIQVVIAPTKSTRYKHLVDVYQASLEAGFKKVGFAQAR